MIKGNFEDKIAKIEKRRSTEKERYLAKVKAAEAARKQLAKFEKEQGQKLQWDLNRTLIACILDIGFEYQDITIIIGSLLKTKAILKGEDAETKVKLINECIDLYNKTAQERHWELNGYKTADDYHGIKVNKPENQEGEDE